ncbi:hypothetical protein MMC22_002581 [Lobaria immixta]|nr:hypothetical protein [Lobaria immixta]
MPLTQEEILRIKELKAAKPLAYDMTPEEWKELHIKTRAEGRRKFYTFVQLLSPFETPSQVKAATRMNDLPAEFQVETCPRNPSQQSSQTISVCRLEYQVWKTVEDRLVHEGYKEPDNHLIRG